MDRPYILRSHLYRALCLDLLSDGGPEKSEFDKEGRRHLYLKNSLSHDKQSRSIFMYMLVTLYSVNVLLSIISSYVDLPLAANDVFTQIFFFSATAVFLFIRTDLWISKPTGSRGK